jgi:hypothetical protein
MTLIYALFLSDKVAYNFNNGAEIWRLNLLLSMR